MTATSPARSSTGSSSSGSTHATPRMTATTVSGASSSIRSDQGGFMLERRRNADRARGPVEKSGDRIHDVEHRRSRMDFRSAPGNVSDLRNMVAPES